MFFWKVFLSQQRITGTLSELPLGSWPPPRLRPFSPITQFVQAARARKSASWLQTSSLYRRPRPLCWFWAFNVAEVFLHPCPDLCLDRILPRRSKENSLDFMAWFVLWHALLPVGPYIDRCVPFQIMSNQLNLSQVDSNQVVETSQGWSVETGCTWAQFWVSGQRLWILMHMGFFSFS